MPNLEDWEISGLTSSVERPRISFGGQGDWLPGVANGNGRGTIAFRRGGAVMKRRDTDTRGFPSGRIRAAMYIGPTAVANDQIGADLNLKFYIQDAGGNGGIVVRTTTFVDRYEAQVMGQDTLGGLEAITDLEETAFASALTSGDFIGWEVRWDSSADPAVDPNPRLQVQVSYYLTDDWQTPIKIQLACCDYALPLWESFYSPIIWGQFLEGPGQGIFLGIATSIWSNGVLKGFQV